VDRALERERQDGEGNEGGSLKYTCLHASVKCYSSSCDTSAHQFNNIPFVLRVIRYFFRSKHDRYVGTLKRTLLGDRDAHIFQNNSTVTVNAEFPVT